MKSPIAGLKKRISLYGDTKMYTIRNQRRGKLDKKMLHKIPLGRTDLFKNIIIDEDKPLDVCLLVDESGSMGYSKMDRARETAVALREALKDNQALNLWVFGHTADGYDWHQKGETNMSVYWSPTYQADLKAMGAMKARAENRDGMAILASADKVRAESPSSSSNKLMIVISDGEPSAEGYRGDMGSQHTKKVVKHLEGQGWNIIQIGIRGAREWRMKEMFTNYLLLEDDNQLANQVSKVIRKVIKV
jgi:nitric oxide reductase activation protein